jgi:hypothetical protein
LIAGATLGRGTAQATLGAFPRDCRSLGGYAQTDCLRLNRRWVVSSRTMLCSKLMLTHCSTLPKRRISLYWSHVLPGSTNAADGAGTTARAVSSPCAWRSWLPGIRSGARGRVTPNGPRTHRGWSHLTRSSSGASSSAGRFWSGRCSKTDTHVKCPISMAARSIRWAAVGEVSRACPLRILCVLCDDGQV